MRILISFLGTGSQEMGKYILATYDIEGKKFENSFFASALNDRFKYDKIILIGTSSSMWENAYMQFVSPEGEVLDEVFSYRSAGKKTGRQGTLRHHPTPP